MRNGRRDGSTVDDELKLPIAADVDVVQARLHGRELAAGAGFSTGDQTVIAAASRDCAQQLSTQAGGEITLRGPQRGSQGVEYRARSRSRIRDIQRPCRTDIRRRGLGSLPGPRLMANSKSCGGRGRDNRADDEGRRLNT